MRTAQELANHSTPTLTMRYLHRRLVALAGAVEKLPKFLPAGTPTHKVQTLRAKLGRALQAVQLWRFLRYRQKLLRKLAGSIS